MKTILVPTDFSTAAEYATQYAAQLAKDIDAAILLLHVYQLPITMGDFPVMIVSAEEVKKNADKGLNKLKEEMQKQLPEVRFETESRMGDVIEEICEACNGKEIVAIITGTKDASGFERFLMGDTTLSLVKKCSDPLIAVPETSKIGVPKKIALALDLADSNEVPIEKILAFVQLLHAELHIVHVENDEEESSPENLPALLKGAIYHSVKKEDVTEGLQHFVTGNKIDLVIVLPHKHSFYEKLFSKNHTDGILHGISVPVMCIQS